MPLIFVNGADARSIRLAILAPAGELSAQILMDAFGGKTPLTEAMNLLNVPKKSALDEMRRALGDSNLRPPALQG